MYNPTSLNAQHLTIYYYLAPGTAFAAYLSAGGNVVKKASALVVYIY